MIKSKLHNPIIAKNSHIENAVVEKVTLAEEQIFSDLGNVSPIVPEIGRIWFNTESGTFKFANIGNGGNGDNYVDEFLSRTDLRAQTVASKVDFADTVRINNRANGGAILKVDSSTQDVTINGASLNTTLTGTNTFGVTGNSTTTVGGNESTTITGTQTTTTTGKVTNVFKGSKETTLTGNFVETVSGNVTVSVGGDVSETITGNQTTEISENLGIKVAKVATLTDGSDNVKIQANNTNNSLTVNYSTIAVNGVSETHTLSDKLVVNDGVSDKLVIDNTNNKVTLVYSTIESTNSTVTANVSNKLTLTNGSTNKIVADHVSDTLDINYGEITVTGNTTVDGNMVVTGDLTIGGKTTKVDVAAENMTIADNVIILNSNLTDSVDPRLASAIVDGTDVDNNAGVAVNRGSEGVLDLIKWVESTDVSSTETLKEGTTNVSIWNYEAATPAYELHQIIDAYTLARQVKDKSGTAWIGYDGEQGTNYKNAIAAGATPTEALDYSYKLDANSLDKIVDSIVQEIDALKFGGNNSVRVGQTSGTGKEFTITHNLGTVFVDVRVQREDAGNWYFDTLPVQVIDDNTIKIVSTEATKIRYMISAIQGFDVNQATELVIA